MLRGLGLNVYRVQEVGRETELLEFCETALARRIYFISFLSDVSSIIAQLQSPSLLRFARIVLNLL